MPPPPPPPLSHCSTKPTAPHTARPVHSVHFDPWNSSATGHQRAENRLGHSTGWRNSRNAKLHAQYCGGAAGGPRVSDTVGEGATHFDQKAGGIVTPGVRARAGRASVADLLARPGSMREYVGQRGESKLAETEEGRMERRRLEDEEKGREKGTGAGHSRGLFQGVVVYVNGSTHPIVSDHTLRHLLAEHGGRVSSHLGRRRQVTHIIIGQPAGEGGDRGAGGGLAGGKLQKEITKLGGAGLKFVGVEWVLESIKAGKRQPETRYSTLKIAPKAQGSVYGLYPRTKATTVGLSDTKKTPMPSTIPSSIPSLPIQSGTAIPVDHDDQPPPSAQPR